MFSALFSKLWRLIRLLGTGFRCFLLKEKDVIRPAANMFILNIIYSSVGLSFLHCNGNVFRSIRFSCGILLGFVQMKMEQLKKAVG